MSRNTWVLLNYTASLSALSQMGASAEVYTAITSTSSLPSSGWTTKNQDVVNIYNASGQYRFYRVRITNTNVTCDLSTLLTNAKIYTLPNSVSLSENDSYSTALQKVLNNYTSVTYWGDRPSYFGQLENNYNYSGTNYRTSIRQSGTNATEYYAIVFDLDWYTDITKRSITQILNNCTSNYPYDYITRDAIHIYLTANSGYFFDTNDITVSGTTCTITRSNNNTYADVYLDSGSTAITVTVWASLIPINYRTLTQSLSNCTSNIADGQVSTNAFTITLTCNNDCDFGTNAIAVTGTTYTITYNSSRTIAYINVNSGSNLDAINVTAIATQHYYHNFSYTVTNATCDLPIDRYESGTELTAVVTPNSGYWFKTPPLINISNAVRTYNSVTGAYTFVWTITSNSTISGSANQFGYFDFSEVFNTDISIDSNLKIFVGETYHIEIDAIDGYYYEETPYITYQDEYMQVRNAYFTVTDSDLYHHSYEIDFTVTRLSYANNVIYASASLIPIHDDIGISTLYVPTSDILADLANARFVGSGANVVDIGDYIIDLIRVFVDVPIHGRQEIILGQYTTGILSPVTRQPIVITDCGVVHVPTYYNNAMDYDNTTINIYLPLYGFMTLDTTKVMGCDVHVEYLTNILNGDVLINIYSNDLLIQTIETTGYYKIPYLLNQQSNPIGAYIYKPSYMGGFTPYITIDRQYPYSDTTITSDNRHVNLDTLQGYNQVIVTDNNIQCTKQERELINTYLRNGVIF